MCVLSGVRGMATVQPVLQPHIQSHYILDTPHTPWLTSVSRYGQTSSHAGRDKTQNYHHHATASTTTSSCSNSRHTISRMDHTLWSSGASYSSFQYLIILLQGRGDVSNSPTQELHSHISSWNQSCTTTQTWPFLQHCASSRLAVLWQSLTCTERPVRQSHGIKDEAFWEHSFIHSFQRSKQSCQRPNRLVVSLRTLQPHVFKWH
jgi:hypothetical protein